MLKHSEDLIGADEEGDNAENQETLIKRMQAQNRYIISVLLAERRAFLTKSVVHLEGTLLNKRILRNNLR